MWTPCRIRPICRGAASSSGPIVTTATKRVGVLALQGAFREHRLMLTALGAVAVEIRRPEELRTVDALILPGGESTTMGRLMQSAALTDPLKDFIRQGNPCWGTCAGMILLATDIGDEPPWLGAMAVRVARNAFGRQQESFELPLEIPAWQADAPPFPAIFIRAPKLVAVEDRVTVTARLADGTPVAAQQDNLWATAFHPELSGDPRLHQAFLNLLN